MQLIMKFFLTSIFLFFGIITQAQINSGEIIYKATLIEEMESPLDSANEVSTEAKNFINNIHRQKIKMLPQFEFDLVFNKNEALFSYAENMSLDNSDVSSEDIAMFTGIYDKFYFNLNKDEIQNQRRFFHDEIILINSKISAINWEVFPETKTIAGFECQKAVTTKYELIEDSYVEKEITVWFSKDIPFSFGPGIAGLPGMILGVETKRLYIYADKVKLNKKDKKISSLKKGRKMTGKEYQKELDEAFKKMEEGNWN